VGDIRYRSEAEFFYGKFDPSGGLVEMRVLLGRAVLVGILALSLSPVVVPSLSAARECTITGTNAREFLIGTAGRDVICARGENDVVEAGSGQDTVRLGRGDDQATGERGRDLLIGMSGLDYLNGGPQRDDLIGRANDDCLNAKDGRPGDDIQGGRGRDYAGYDPGDNVRAEVRNSGVCPERPVE
jgi:Ca2+-binding RTX toxin-like protein